MQPSTSAPEPSDSAASDAAALAENGDAEAAASTPAETRKAGDYVVYEFSGSFQSSPLKLTERVVAHEGSELVVDVTLDDGAERQTMRIRMGDAPGSEVTSARRLEGATELPATVEDFEALLLRTTLAADQNEALLGSEDTTIKVGGFSIPCTETSFRVRVGKHEATLRTLQSDGFAWGDVGGEIVTTDGSVLYRAKLVEMGTGAGEKAAAVAHGDFDYE